MRRDKDDYMIVEDEEASNDKMLPLSIDDMYDDDDDPMSVTYTVSSNRETRQSKCLFWFSICFFVVVVTCSVSALVVFSQDGQTHREASLSDASTMQGLQHAAVASDHPLCSAMGRDVLQKRGGNVVDAAITTALCLGVANPSASGIGGGAFVLIHINETNDNAVPHVDARQDKNDNNLLLVDCRETAPRDATQDMYLANGSSSTVGGMAVAVPGELRCWELAHARHGRLPWSELLRPVLDELKQGVRVSGWLARTIAEHGPWRKGQSLQSLLSRGGAGMEPLQEGDLYQNPALMETLERVAQEGPNAFYQLPDLAKDIGGILTQEDLVGYQATLRTPLMTQVGPYTLVGAPPPSSGGATIMGALRFLSGYHDGPYHHRLVEAMRHAFAIRMSLSDPAFSPNEDAVQDLLGDYMETLRLATRDDTTLPLSQYGGKWSKLQDDDAMDNNAADADEGDRKLGDYLNDHGTTHVSVVDAAGNAVSLTSSINTYFGAGVLSHGVLMNNQMDDFSSPDGPNFFGLPPSEANFIAPGKKPLSSMSPTFVMRDGRIVMALGASGGPKIISATLQTLYRHLFRGESLSAAVQAPRVHDQLLYHHHASCLYERDLPETIQEDLVKHGHHLVPFSYAGAVQAVAVDQQEGMVAVSDARKEGKPAGY